MTRFRNVDQHDAIAAEAYLVAVARQLSHLKRATYDLLETSPGQHLLEVGCGAGGDVLALAERVTPRGSVLGVDLSVRLIESARRHAADSALPVEFRVGDAHKLDLADDAFDGARVERTLQHVQDPGAVLAEIRRVVRPGGVVVAAEPDWETIVIDCSDRALLRSVTQSLADEHVRHGWAGRQLPRLMHELSFDDIEVHPMTAMFSTYDLASYVLDLRNTLEQLSGPSAPAAAEIDAWKAELRERSDRGRFFASITWFAVKARTPY